jgi:chromosome segregation ATPase
MDDIEERVEFHERLARIETLLETIEKAIEDQREDDKDLDKKIDKILENDKDKLQRITKVETRASNLKATMYVFVVALVTALVKSFV